MVKHIFKCIYPQILGFSNILQVWHNLSLKLQVLCKNQAGALDKADFLSFRAFQNFDNISRIGPKFTMVVDTVITHLLTE